MSDQVSDNRNNQLLLRHCPDQNDLTRTPSPFSRRSYHPNHSAIDGPGEHPPFHHDHRPINSFAKPPLTATTNLRYGMWGRGGAKAYFRFHGGIGDGRGGAGYRATEEITAARPLQLFEALNPAHFQINVLKKACAGGFVNPATGECVPAMETSTGTGVFLPVYPKRIGFAKTDACKTNAGMCVGGGRRGHMKQDEEKRFGVEEEGKEFDEIPIELLLPPEWTY
ncbi:hypothetical protein L1887_19156 [Cichorium endivia]|nr:hypothetical protein L1887_19156 [Cichorium endivia]